MYFNHILFPPTPARSLQPLYATLCSFSFLKTKTKPTKQTENQIHTHTHRVGSVLCYPTSPKHGVCSEVCLIYPVSVSSEEHRFSLSW